MLNTVKLIGNISNVIAQAYGLARERLANTSFSILRLNLHRDHKATEASLLQREVAVLRGQRERMKPKSRPDYSGTERLEILQIMRLRGWNVATTAERFVLHANTIRAWIRALEDDDESARLFEGPMWNTIHDVIRWTVQEIRKLCPEPEVGSR
jgi:transposase-like protein